MPLPTDISLRRVAFAAAPLLALAVVLSTPGLLGGRVASTWTELAAASPPWLWLALAGFLASVLGTALSWRTVLNASGASIGRIDAVTRYGVGCLVNSFAPASAGEAVRIALISRRLDGPQRLWTTGGAVASVAAVRGLVFAGLVVTASLIGALPLWPVAALCGAAALAAAAALVVRRRRPGGRIGEFVESFTLLLREPLVAARVAAWSVASQAAKLGAAAAVAAALAVPHPLLAALVIVPALQLTTAFPITPGSIGIASGAVTLALTSRGVGLAQALATGIAFHAAETLVGVSFGLAGTLAVVPVPTLVRRVAIAGGCAAFAVGLGMTVIELV